MAEFKSVAPCDPEQYVAPNSKSEIHALQESLLEDIKLTRRTGEIDLLLTILCNGAAAEISQAELMLGELLSNDDVLGKNETRARYWLRRAAAQGDPEAQWALSVLYLNGRGGPPYKKEGMRLLRASANAGSPDGCYDLAAEYIRGDKLPRSRKKAILWAQRAQRAGHPHAQELLSALKLP